MELTKEHKEKLRDFVRKNNKLKHRNTLMKYINDGFDTKKWALADIKLLNNKSKIAVKDYYESEILKSKSIKIDNSIKSKDKKENLK